MVGSLKAIQLYRWQFWDNPEKERADHVETNSFSYKVLNMICSDKTAHSHHWAKTHALPFLPEDWKKPGFYGRAEFYWNPLVLESVDIRVGAAAHFNGAGFCGWQQKLSVVFDLDGNIWKRLKRSR